MTNYKQTEYELYAQAEGLLTARDMKDAERSAALKNLFEIPGGAEAILNYVTTKLARTPQTLQMADKLVRAFPIADAEIEKFSRAIQQEIKALQAEAAKAAIGLSHFIDFVFTLENETAPGSVADSARAASGTLREITQEAGRT